ncbi:MAG: polymorphic toxin type 50 domain-containing protein [Clostridia bacterium]
MGGRGRNSDRYYLHWGKQGKHIVGHNNYRNDGRSIITISRERIQELFNQYRGTGVRVGNRERHVNFEEIIGKYHNMKTGEEFDTTWGTIHYNEDVGYHIVPEIPK